MKWQALVVLLAACGGSRGAPPPAEPVDEPASSRITSEQQAVERFDAIFPALIDRSSGPQLQTLRSLWDARLYGRASGPSASQTACADLAALVIDTLGPDGDPIVAGTVRALDTPEDRCWLVTLAVDLHTLMVAVDADSGTLRLAWLPPEG